MADAPGTAADSSRCIIYHGPATTPDDFAGSGVEPSQWHTADELLSGEGSVGASVLIADGSMLENEGALCGVPSHAVIVAADVDIERSLGERGNLSVAEFRDAASRGRVLRSACKLACTRLAVIQGRRQLARASREIRELSDVGLSLMQQRELSVLLREIIALGKRATDSDGCGLFLLEEREGEPPILRMVMYDFTSLPNLPRLDVTRAVDDTSIVGHTAVIRKPVVIDDAHALPRDSGFRLNREFDEQYGYYMRSMLVVPMIDHRDRLVGLLYLLNRVSDPTARITSREAADRYVLPYTRRQVRLARVLASYASVSIENARLYAQIEALLESFVKAAVTAVDERDPTTAGHSLRVATLATDLARALEREGRGQYRDLHFTRAQMRELHFAALLHDFGKLSVHEEVLLKAKKLPPVLWERVYARFDLIRCRMQIAYHERREQMAVASPQAIAQLEAELSEEITELERVRTIVREANEPHIVAEYPIAELREIAQRTFDVGDGRKMPYLTPEELHYLELPRGTLDENERAAVESHVVGTMSFLSQIPWTDDLKNLTKYASGHHEKLDGSGYPQRLQGEDILLQTRMITLADMFDALTASDRPYKPAVSPERALEIIQSDAKRGLLDPELVRVMVESKVYRRVLERDWRTF